MEYFNKLNEGIKNTIKDNNLYFQLKYLDEVVKLAYIIIENTPELNRKQNIENIPLNTSLETAIGFFSTINKEYSSLFYNMLHQESNSNLSFSKISEGKNQSRVTKDGHVYIEYENSLDDVFTIVHETTHKFSYVKNNNSIIKQFLGETPPITMEFLLQDYLLEKYPNKKEEILTRKNNRLKETYDDAVAIIFENTLLKLYEENNNQITNDILLKFLQSMDKDSKIYELFLMRGPNYLDEIITSKTLSFPKRQRYVIGTLLASNMYHEIKNTPKKNAKITYFDRNSKRF